MDRYSARQQDIITGAIDLIAERSIQAMTIKNLAARIGVTEAALYRHFPSKMDILLAILETFKSGSAQVLAQVQTMAMSPLDKIDFIFMNRFAIFRDKPSLAAVIFSEEIFQNDRRLSEVVRATMDNNENLIRSLIEQGQQDGSIRSDIRKEELSTMMVGGLRLLVTRWRLSGYSFDLQTLGRNYLNALQMVLRAPE